MTQTRYINKKHISDELKVCRLCTGEIKPGQRYVVGLTKEPYHPQCKQGSNFLRPKVEVPAVIVNSPIILGPSTERCWGCSDLIGDEHYVTRNGESWHKECYRRELEYLREKRM